MKYYRRKKYDSAWPYALGILALFVLYGFLGHAIIRNLEQSQFDLPAPEVVEAPVQVVEEPVAEPAQEPQRWYTQAELDMVALVIYQEAGGDTCSDETRLMVGNVVMNRVADDRFPNNLYDVVTQRAQYGRLYWTGLEWPERASKAEEAHAVARAYEIAERILGGERVLPGDVVFQAEFTQGTEVVAHQDGMYFCR